MTGLIHEGSDETVPVNQAVSSSCSFTFGSKNKFTIHDTSHTRQHGVFSSTSLTTTAFMLICDFEMVFCCSWSFLIIMTDMTKREIVVKISKIDSIIFKILLALLSLKYGEQRLFVMNTSKARVQIRVETSTKNEIINKAKERHFATKLLDKNLVSIGETIAMSLAKQAKAKINFIAKLYHKITAKENMHTAFSNHSLENRYLTPKALRDRPEEKIGQN